MRPVSVNCVLTFYCLDQVDTSHVHVQIDFDDPSVGDNRMELDHKETVSSYKNTIGGAMKRNISKRSSVCKCGSSDHKRTSHKLCPLNKKQRQLEVLDQGDSFMQTQPLSHSQSAAESSETSSIEVIPDAMIAPHGEILDSGGTVMIHPEVSANDIDAAVSGETVIKKPCRCESTEHQRISHKSCPLYRGPVVDRMKQTDNDETYSTVKMSLNQFLSSTLDAKRKEKDY